jgi:pimeloyl-ACP methyl ester carboxylesterase
VVLVHGYPDAAEVWSMVAERLAEDYQVVAYDVRGAGRSTAPHGTAPYALPLLVDDLAAVIDAVSPDAPVHVVGHDWGALQCWEAVASKRLHGRVASFSAGTPSLDHVGLWFQRRFRQPNRRKLAEAVSQMLGSAYMLMFQLPVIPELTWLLLLGRRWHRLLARTDRISVAARSTQMSDGQRGLGLYRANLMPRLFGPQPRVVNVPVQLLISRRDPFVPRRMFEDIEQWVPQLRRTQVDGGHWSLLSHPDSFANAIDQYVTSIVEA